MPERIRVWPALLLVAVYWIFQVVVGLSDVGMYPLFMSKAFGALGLLIVFLVLWLTNGTLPWRVRFLGLGLFVGALLLGILAAHKSFEPFGYMMTTVPWAITAWTAWMAVSRWNGVPRASLAGVILIPFATADLIRFEGLSGRLDAGLRWRWTASDEERFLAAKTASAGATARTWTLRGGDWPEFRGALRDGAVRGTRIAPDWSPEPVWKRLVGPAWSGMILVDGFLVTQEQRGESEAVVCYDAATGKEQWAHEVAGRFTEGVSGPGPRATPTYREGRIYALGAKGSLVCLDAASGKPVWTSALGKDPAPMWGCSASPLVAEGKVVVFVGGPGGRGVLALDAATGKPAWTSEGGKESYCSAQLLTIRGKAQIVMIDNKRTAGLSLADGAVLWQRPGESESIVPMIQPHPVDDGLILVSSGEDLTLLELQSSGGTWTATEKWTTRKFKPSFNDFVVHEGHAYGLDGGILACVDLKSGERVWKKGRYGGGQLLLLADQGLLVVLSEKGELALVEARPQAPADAALIPAIEGKTWNHPTLVGDRLYVRNAAEMACFRLKLKG